MGPSNSIFYDTDHPELRKAVSDIIKSIAQSSQEREKELFEALSAQVEKMNLEGLGLGTVDKILKKPYKSSNKI